MVRQTMRSLRSGENNSVETRALVAAGTRFSMPAIQGTCSSALLCATQEKTRKLLWNSANLLYC